MTRALALGLTVLALAACTKKEDPTPPWFGMERVAYGTLPKGDTVGAIPPRRIGTYEIPDSAIQDRYVILQLQDGWDDFWKRAGVSPPRIDLAKEAVLVMRTVPGDTLLPWVYSSGGGFEVVLHPSSIAPPGAPGEIREVVAYAIPAPVVLSDVFAGPTVPAPPPPAHDPPPRGRAEVRLREAQARVTSAQAEYYLQHGRFAATPEALDSLISALMPDGGRELGLLTREEMHLQITEASDSAFRFSMRHGGKRRSCSVRVGYEPLCTFE